MTSLKSLLLITGLLSITACSTIVSGTQQSLFIDTPQMEGASCKLNDSKGGNWYLESTPGSVSVAKGNGPMNVHCTKKGYKATVVSVEEGFAGATLGNIILGGGIGVFVDAASGAAQKYPDKVIVWMEPTKWKDSAEKKAWHEEKQAYEEEIKRKAEELKQQQQQNKANND